MNSQVRPLKIRFSFTIFATLLLFVQPAFSEDALAKKRDAAAESVVATFGDWSKICSELPSGKQACQISQTVNQDDLERRLFQTTIGYVAESENPLIFMTAPLGMYLPRGITLELSEDTLLRSVVQRCDASGCLAISVLEPAFVAEMKAALEGKFVFGATAEQNVAIPLSLKGFTAGLASIAREPSAKEP